MEEGGQLVVGMASPPVEDEGVGEEHGFEPANRIRPLPAGLGELLEVGGHHPLVPRQQHRLGVGEVLVEGGRPLPARSATRDIVIVSSPSSASAATASRMAFVTWRRWASIVSVQSFGTGVSSRPDRCPHRAESVGS